VLWSSMTWMTMAVTMDDLMIFFGKRKDVHHFLVG
jgi:hypothetical protein